MQQVNTIFLETYATRTTKNAYRLPYQKYGKNLKE